MEPVLADADTTGRSSDEVAVRLNDLLCRAVGIIAPVRVDRVRPDHRLVGDLAFDSLRLLELACILDDLFGLQTMSLDDAPMNATVGELLDYVEQKLAAGEATCPDVQQAEAVLRDLTHEEG
jgi:acyl carrier protein